MIVPLGLQKEKAGHQAAAASSTRPSPIPRRERATWSSGTAGAGHSGRSSSEESRWGHDVFSISPSAAAHCAGDGGQLLVRRHGTGHLKGVALGVPLRMFTTAYKGGKEPDAGGGADRRTRRREYYTSLDVSSLALDVLEQQYGAEAQRDPGGRVRPRAAARAPASRPAHSAERPRTDSLPTPIIPPARTVETERGDRRADRGRAGGTPAGYLRWPRCPPFDSDGRSRSRSWRPTQSPPGTPRPYRSLRSAPGNGTNRSPRPPKSDWESRFEPRQTLLRGPGVRSSPISRKAAGIKVLLFIPPTPIDMQRTLITPCDRMDHRVSRTGSGWRRWRPYSTSIFPNPLTAKAGALQRRRLPLPRLRSPAEIAHELVRHFGVSSARPRPGSPAASAQCPSVVPGSRCRSIPGRLPGDTPVIARPELSRLGIDSPPRLRFASRFAICEFREAADRHELVQRIFATI